jgi:two-component system, sensor histidine kinase RegB
LIRITGVNGTIGKNVFVAVSDGTAEGDVGMSADWGRAWWGGHSPGVLQDTPQLALRVLAGLRLFTPLAQAITLLVVTTRFDVSLQMEPVVVLIGLELLLAGATWVRLWLLPRASALELFLHVELDVALLTAMLYLTGGVTNPFAPLFLLPMALAAAALPPRLVWLVTLSTIAAYAFLRSHHLALQHPEGHTEVYELHESGMVVNYLLTAVLLTFISLKAVTALRSHERMLTAARDAQMRNESVVAIGALAAGHAHELGSPLSTVAVLVSELQRERAHDQALLRDLKIMAEQIERCKDIVSNLVASAGRRRADSVGVATVREFVDSIVERARSLHPGATIELRIDRTAPSPRIVVEDTLRQAITNLIDNAVQASPQTVVVIAAWSPSELSLSVLDNGPGFPPELLRHLGKHVHASAKGPGRGMGLLLTAATLERLGGALELSNQPESGARADVRIALRSLVLPEEPTKPTP